MKILKISILLVSWFSVSVIIAQNREIEREWVYFLQTIEVETEDQVNFKLKASVKTVTENTGSSSYLCVEVIEKNGEDGAFYRVNDTVVVDSKWTTYVVEGSFDDSALAITIGGGAVGNGRFYFDDFQLYFQTEGGDYQEVPIANAGFEKHVADDTIPDWLQEQNEDKTINKIKGFSFHSSDEKYTGTSALMILGEGVKHDNSYYIMSEEGYSPQMGVLISMLNNLSNRVEKAVENLDQRETDFLLDEKANSIGALVMHLAAGEKFYQNLTFENRRFNREEQEMWQVGVDLGQEARDKFVGNPISYYLDLYKQVRRKTLEELKKRNDEWLAASWPGARMNNYYAWFHVMEHQSRHLGQILLLKGRIPAEEKVKAKVKME